MSTSSVSRLRIYTKMLVCSIVLVSDLTWADSLFMVDRTVVGKLVSRDATGVMFDVNCDGEGGRIFFEHAQVVGVEFNEICDGTVGGIEPPPILPVCDSSPLLTTAVEFVGGGETLYAQGVVIEDGHIHLHLFYPMVNAHGPLTAVRKITDMYVCREVVSYKSEFQPAFCVERQQMAAEFNYGAPLSNKILTNGFSIYIKKVGEFSDEQFSSISENVRSAFSTALTLWLAGLRDNEHLVDEETRDFLQSRVSTSSSGHQMFLPPQVIQVQCPDTAVFQVMIIGAGSNFFEKNRRFLAKASIEGRTIALNFATYPCQETEVKFYGKKKNPRYLVSPGCLNLLPIVTHELGHAFGIEHLDENGLEDLMDKKLVPSALRPSIRDLEAFADVLKQSIVGDKPGELVFKASDGVLPPDVH